MSDAPATPTLDRRNALLAESQKIGDFLDWLSDQGIHLARWERVDRELLLTTTESFDSLLHRYFKIDPVAEEAEKRALLDYIRSQP